MIAVLCLDDQNGMMFNKRRQSRDREVISDILQMSKTTRLWMNEYSAKLFEEMKEEISCEAAFLEKAGEGEFCFVENEQLGAYADKIEKLILYKWNRKYPADFFFDFDFSDWKLKESTEFQGNSHEKVTKEVYDRKGD